MTTLTKIGRDDIIWGFAGPPYSGFNFWMGDQLINKLNFCVKYGFKSTSIGLNEIDDPQRRDEILPIIQDNNMKMTTHFSLNFMAEDKEAEKAKIGPFLEKLEEYGPMLNILGVQSGTGHCTRYTRTPSMEDQWDWAEDVYTPLSQGCHDLGYSWCIENHVDYFVADLVKLARRIPHMGINIDTGNCLNIGEDAVAAAELAAPYIVATHLKDFIPVPNPGNLSLDMQGCVLGEGFAGIDTIFRILMEKNPHPERIAMQWEAIKPKDWPKTDIEFIEDCWVNINKIIDDYFKE